MVYGVSRLYFENDGVFSSPIKEFSFLTGTWIPLLRRYRSRLMNEKVMVNQSFIIVTFLFQYGLTFYLQYLAHWPEYFQVTEAPGGEIMGYSKCKYFA